jgi:cell division protease FtsH
MWIVWFMPAIFVNCFFGVECFFSLKTTKSFLKYKSKSNYFAKTSDDETLYNIDNQIEKVVQRMKILKKQKYSILSKIKNNHGLKLFNESEIDEQNYDNDNDIVDNNHNNNYHDPDSTTFQFPIGISVFIPPTQKSLLQKKNQRTKSEHFHLAKLTGNNFSQVGGYETIKTELMQCADILLHPKKYSAYSVDVPKGIIFEGPPGNGKTHLTRCFAGELNISFIPVSGSQFQEMYVGVGASRVRELFELARENAPTIIFIDEIDAIGRKRSGMGVGESSNSERDSTLNQLLVEMDGIEKNEGIFVIGATNRADLLDNALTRPGRIDKSLYIGLPDKKTREMILNVHIKGKPINPAITIEIMTEMTQGMSGAQIKNWLNEATLLAIRRAQHKEKVQTQISDLNFMLNRILVGSQSFEIKYSDKTLYQIAVHEMGHAIVGILHKEYNRLIKVSLNTWSPKSPGLTLFESREDEPMQNKQKLIIHLAVLLAGRVAEEEFFPDHISTGASHDLESAKQIAFDMITKYGMGVRTIHPLGSFDQGSSSDGSKQDIENEIKVLIDRAFAKSRLIITHSKTLIEEGARYLVSEHNLTPEWILQKINKKYPYLLKLD